MTKARKVPRAVVATLYSMTFHVEADTAERALTQAATHAPLRAFRSTTEQVKDGAWTVTLEFRGKTTLAPTSRPVEVVGIGPGASAIQADGGRIPT